MSRFLFSASIIVAFSLVAAGAARAQAIRIGFVNSSKILAEYAEAQDAQKKLDAMSKGWQGELERMSSNLQAQYEDFQKKEALMNEQTKRDKREELVALEQKGLAFRQEKFGQNGDLAAATDSLLGPIKKKVMKVIEAVAKDEKLTFIFDRNDQILVLLYGDVKYDYTYRVIDRLKRGKVTGGPEN